MPAEHRAIKLPNLISPPLVKRTNLWLMLRGGNHCMTTSNLDSTVVEE